MAGLYIHIPFCHSKCIYCDFYSTADRRRAGEFFEALGREYSRRKSEIKEPFTTIYIGGGTPSIVDSDLLGDFIGNIPLESVEEFTIEVNPEDVSPEKIRAWRKTGINRVSMGIQSFDDEQLQTIRRRHSAADALKAVSMIRNGGIENISCDLIYGLPGQSLESWRQSLDMLLDLRLPHLSAYCLSYEPGTALYARRQAGKVTPTDDDSLSQMYRYLCEATAAAGYEHYEISNFALPGRHSRHNFSYWDSTPYLGLGPGAHSFDGAVRRYNPGNLKLYIESESVTTVDKEDETQRYNDLLITALRTARGLNLASVSTSRRACLLHAASKYIASGAMSLDSDRLRISEAGWFISDSILVDLIEE